VGTDRLKAMCQYAECRGVAMCQYAQWVSPLDPQVDLYTRAAAPPHTRLCLPFARLKNLAQLRIGCAHLEVEQGRKRRQLLAFKWMRWHMPKVDCGSSMHELTFSMPLLCRRLYSLGRGGGGLVTSCSVICFAGYQ
jgi:hypothetical protein